jgi:hypothetical protein
MRAADVTHNNTGPANKGLIGVPSTEKEVNHMPAKKKAAKKPAAKKKAAKKK